MENTAKNFAVQLGSLISLYISISALITLLFGVITVLHPDAMQGYWEYESAASSIRFGIAMLIVFFPTYIVLTRIVNTTRRSEQGTYLKLTKWLIYISLLLGGIMVLGDFVVVINAFLNGELTIRFLLKALVFFLVVGASFGYYLCDARGYWQTREKKSLQYAGVVSVVVLASILFGFLNIEAPAEVREMRIDERQVNDLSNIQGHIESYYYQNEILPASVNEAFSGVAIPTAPEGRAPYIYNVTDSDTYTLCAEFARESMVDSPYNERLYYDMSITKGLVTWEHGAGEWCYTRSAPEVEAIIR